MKQLIYVSRAFVEFGPFAAKEILDFEKRGLLRDTDYLRCDGQDDWVHVQTWITDAAPALKAKKAPAKPKAKAATPAKKKAATAKPKAKTATKKAAASKPKAKSAKKAA